MVKAESLNPETKYLIKLTRIFKTITDNDNEQDLSFASHSQHCTAMQ